MIEIIGVRFNKAGKIYYFDPRDLKVPVDSNVIVETSRGLEMGTVAISNKKVDEKEVIQPLKPITRIASGKDLAQAKKNREKETEAFEIASKKIHEHKLEMKLINVEYTFDGSKILFYFTADGRVDFRELVKSLAGIFKTRIELRQIGVRDETKLMGAVGICGRFLCCSTFLGDFQPVSIKMAKEQGLSLNPTKISGVCGRLMCCLQYEQDGYEEMLKIVPPRDSIVSTPEGKGVVTETFVIKGLVKVKISNEDGTYLKIFDANDIKVIKKGKAEQNNNEELIQDLE